MNVVIYCRVSSKEQVEGTSLETQEIGCKEYAARHQLVISRVFVERGESAKVADRTQLLEVFEFCRNHENEVEQLLVWKVDRLARNVGDHFNIKAALLKLGVRVVSVTEPIDAKPEGRLLETVLAGFAQFDNDIRAARTLQGMRRKIQEGLFPWKAPLGYRSERRSGTKKTDPDQPDLPTFSILQQGWQALATGQHTKAEVQRLMTGCGLRTKLGKPVSSQTIDNIFDDIFYAGVIRDPWTGEEYPGKHVPMISRDVFDTVQRVIHLRNRSIPHLSLRPEFPLRSLARCTACEFTLTGSFSRGRSKYYPYYHCHHPTCGLPRNYSLAEVHAEFAGFLRTMSADGHAIDHLKEWAEEIAQSCHDLSERLRAKRELDTKHLRDQQQRLIQMRIDNLISDEEFRTQRKLIDSQLDHGAAPLALDIHALPSLPAKVERICGPLQDLATFWESHQIETRKRFQRLLLPVGYVVTRIGTAPKARILSFLDGSLSAIPTEVALDGESWNQMACEITKLAAVVNGEPDPDDSPLPAYRGLL
jgi:site-specific DNA recombinase